MLHLKCVPFGQQDVGQVNGWKLVCALRELCRSTHIYFNFHEVCAKERAPFQPVMSFATCFLPLHFTQEAIRIVT